MSTAANHRKRSHRSNFRARAFNGGRRSVIKPTANKGFFRQMINKIAKFLSKKKGENDNA